MNICVEFFGTGKDINFFNTKYMKPTDNIPEECEDNDSVFLEKMSLLKVDKDLVHSLLGYFI